MLVGVLCDTGDFEFLIVGLWHDGKDIHVYYGKRVTFVTHLLVQVLSFPLCGYLLTVEQELPGIRLTVGSVQDGTA